MNETIGVKGGHNDYRRVMVITKKQKEKLKKYQEEKELKELEKEVKKKQVYTLLKTIPLVITGQTFKELTKPKNKKEEIEEKFIVEEKEEEKTKKIVIVLKDGTKQIIEVPISIEKYKEEITPEVKKELPKEKKEETKEELITEPKLNKEEEPVKEEKQNYIPIKEEKKKGIDSDFSNLPENQKVKLQKLQARKIIDVYERQLKDIRYELRNLIIEYNTLVDEEERIIRSKEAEIILDRLSEIIKKIDDLKEKIRIEDLDKYDDNYIYTLIEGYLEDFKDKKLIKEIKDSPLYVAISEKLDEFDKRKEKFKFDLEEKKDELSLKEERLEELKEKYSSIDKFNKDIEDFYREQELLLKEMEEKIDKAVTVTEKVEVQVESMNIQTRLLLKHLALIMLMPGPKGAKKFAAIATIYSEMARTMLNPKTTTKKYTEIKVQDYSRDIEKNIDLVEDATIDLSKAGKDVDKIISKIKEEFSDYIGVIPECDELLSNLNKVKENLKEKEYELEKIKEKQKLELARNNAKVLMR